MSGIKRAKPSPALLIAVLALVVALGGGAAAGVAVTALNKKERKQVKRIAKRQATKRIDQREPRLNVKSAETAARAAQATNAQNAANAAAAETAETAGNADTVDGLDANSLLRVAGASDDNPPQGDGEIVSTTITAPTAGYLMIVASVDAGSRFGAGGGDGIDGFDCRLALDGAGGHGNRSVRVSPDNSEENCTTNVLLDVAAGFHVIALEGNSVNTADVAFVGADIQVLFAPFDGAGG